MMPATLPRLKFGPADHGRAVTEEELGIAEYQTGYNYEIIDGGLYVSPVPKLPEAFLDDWLYGKLHDYVRSHPNVVNYLNDKARVHIPDRDDLTIPEPDIAVYQDFPTGKLIRDLNWGDISPLIVVEILVDSDPEKDLIRNVGLYWDVPSIKEYWVLDGRENCDEPVLIARRRYGSRWLIQEVPYSETYRTPTLPDFELLIDPRK